MKKAISLFLALMMCLSLLTLTAQAADSDFLIEDGVLVKYNGEYGHVAIPDGVTAIGNDVFNNLIGGLASVTIPDSVTSIGDSAFAFTDLTSVTIPDSVTTIGAYAFTHSALTSVTIPNSVTTIGTGAFGNCENLTSIVLSDNLTTISGSMLSVSSKLTSVTIPDGVTAIEDFAFFYSENLTTVVIPDSVTTIGKGVFTMCDNVTLMGAAGSYAETYAEENGISFEVAGAPAAEEKPSSWAQANVDEAIENGLVPQDLQGKYTQATTREEFAALAVQLYETVTGTTITERATFDDTTDVNVEKAAAIGVVNGVGDNKFNPSAALTREQAATMLARLAEAVGQPLDAQAATFEDSDGVASWASEAVGQMQASGVMSGTGDNKFSPKGAYTREQSIVTALRLFNIVK